MTKELTDLEALRIAIVHYESEVKKGKDHDKPVLEGLIEAHKELYRYKDLKGWIRKKVFREGE